jgi:membrane protein implicated in regulation of membrane protease activity
MEKIVINRDSWHYKIAKIVADYPNDICAYRTAFMKASFLLLVGAIVALVHLTTIVHAIIGFAFALFYGYGILTELSIFGFISIVVVFSMWRHNKRDQKPSVVTQAYRSWKEKHCAPVIIE